MSCNSIAAVRANRMKNVGSDSFPRDAALRVGGHDAPIFRAVRSAVAPAKVRCGRVMTASLPSVARMRANFPSTGTAKGEGALTPQDYLNAVRLSAFARWMDICLKQEQSWSKHGVPRVPAVLLLLV